MDQPYPSKPMPAISPPRWIHDKWRSTLSPSLPHPPSPFPADHASSRSSSFPPGSAQTWEPWATDLTRWGGLHDWSKGDSYRPSYGDESQGEGEGRSEGRETRRGSGGAEARWDGTVVKSWEKKEEGGMRGWGDDKSGAGGQESGFAGGNAHGAISHNSAPSSFSRPSIQHEKVQNVRIPAQPDLDAWLTSQRISALALDSDGLPTQDINVILPAGLHPGQTLVLCTRPLLPGHNPDPRKWPNELYTESYVIPYPSQWTTESQRRADRPGVKSWEGGEHRKAMCPDAKGRWTRWVRTVQRDEGLEVRWKQKPVREIERRWGWPGGASVEAAPADNRGWAGAGGPGDGGWAKAHALQRSVSSPQTSSSVNAPGGAWGNNTGGGGGGRKRAWTESLSGNQDPAGGWGKRDERPNKAARMDERPSGGYSNPTPSPRASSPPHLPGDPAAWLSRASLDRATPPHLPQQPNNPSLSRASPPPMDPRRPRAVSYPTNAKSYPARADPSPLEDEISKKHEEIEHIHAVLHRCGEMEARLRGVLEKSEGEMRALRNQAGRLEGR
ncbi:hypothetical protein IAT38_006443 [Cryptococcus sp. DSM 104549]